MCPHGYPCPPALEKLRNSLEKCKLSVSSTLRVLLIEMFHCICVNVCVLAAAVSDREKKQKLNVWSVYSYCV